MADRPSDAAGEHAEEHAAGAGAKRTVPTLGQLPRVGAAVLVQWADKQTVSDTGTWPAIVLEVDRTACAVKCHYMGTGGGHRRQGARKSPLGRRG